MTTLSSETIGDALRAGTARLERAGVGAARHDAELLLAHLLGTDRGGLFLRRGDTLDGRIAQRYSGWIRRRAGREPLQHVTQVQEFYGLSLLTDRRALVPRPETEGLVEAALGLAPASGARVVDLGTGSGCIVVALAVVRPDLRIHALDRSPTALALARENAARHEVEARIEFVEGDLYRGVVVTRKCTQVGVACPAISCRVGKGQYLIDVRCIRGGGVGLADMYAEQTRNATAVVGHIQGGVAIDAIIGLVDA